MPPPLAPSSRPLRRRMLLWTVLPSENSVMMMPYLVLPSTSLDRMVAWLAAASAMPSQPLPEMAFVSTTLPSDDTVIPNTQLLAMVIALTRELDPYSMTPSTNPVTVPPLTRTLDVPGSTLTPS